MAEHGQIWHVRGAMGDESDEERYAEGKREVGTCRHCGQPIWYVYHGPNRNHTIEPRVAADTEPDEGEQ